MTFYILRREQRRLWGNSRFEFQNFTVTSVCIVCTTRKMSGKIKVQFSHDSFVLLLKLSNEMFVSGKFDFKQNTKTFSSFCWYGNRDCKKAPGCHTQFEVRRFSELHYWRLLFGTSLTIPNYHRKSSCQFQLPGVNVSQSGYGHAILQHLLRYSYVLSLLNF